MNTRAALSASAPVTRSEIFARVAEILSDSFEVPPERVLPDAHLVDDLDLDSIDGIDLVVRLEQETGLDVSEDELKAIQTVQDITDLMHRKLTERERDVG